MEVVKFQPATLKVSKGAMVIWPNDDTVVRCANSNPHPNHNALPGLNSLEISCGPN